MKGFLKVVGAFWALVVIIVVIVALASGSGGSSKPKTTSLVSSPLTHSHHHGTSKPSMTPSQANAVQAAQDYLQTTAFSRKGLIEQLSSQAGDGYSLADATFAVDHIKVDYNAEAVQAAKDYLQTSPFSCTDLIQQLDSSAGDKYTPAQAQYGAHKAGVCK